MICPHCKKTIPQEARFCLHCGVVLPPRTAAPSASSPLQTVGAVPARPNPRRRWLYSSVVLVLLLLPIGIWVMPRAFRQRVWEAPVSSGNPSGTVTGTPVTPYQTDLGVVQAPKPAPSGQVLTGVTQAPVAPKNPAIGVTEAPAPPPSDQGVLSVETPPPPKQQEAPAEILEYLKKLQDIEERRVALGNDFGPAMEMLQEALGMRVATQEEARGQHSEKISGGYDTYYQKWDQLRSDFGSIPVPAACQALALSYRDALFRYAAAITRIWSAFQGQDISALTSMRSNMQGEINRYLSSADAALEQLCRSYHIRKPFDIRKDINLDSSLLGF